MPSPSDSEAYLREVLTPGFLLAPDRPLGIRARRTRDEGSEPECEEPPPSLDREEMSVRVHRLQHDFFELSQSELRAVIEELSAEPYPEYENLLRRYGILQGQRESLRKLKVSPELDTAFVNRLLQILILPQAQASKLRAQINATLGLRKTRKRLIKTVRKLKRHHPQVFQLEAAWLGDILSRTQFYRGLSTLLPTWVTVVVSIVLGLVVMLSALLNV